MNEMKKSFLTLATVALLFCLAPALPAAAEEVADVVYQPHRVDFYPSLPHDGATLTVAGPGKNPFMAFFEASEEMSFTVDDPQTGPRPDGVYTFELRLIPDLDESVLQEIVNARETGDMSVVEQLCADGVIPNEASLATGSFTILGGQIEDPYLEEELPSLTGDAPAFRTSAGAPLTSAAAPAASGGDLENVHAPDWIVQDDLIVLKSACIGFDCKNGESFGFDTVKLKENNTRFRFEDTSSTGSFPTNDWQIQANDYRNGGASYLSFVDVNSGKTPFTVRATAPSHSLYVDGGGRVGFGTSTPIVDLHVRDGETPTLRLDQDGTSGFYPQTWDIAGNEANFFVRDATNGSKLPFRIRPKAPTSSLLIDGTGDVGMGTSSPQKSLHVKRTDGTGAALIEEAGEDESPRILMNLKNNGRVLLQMEDTSANGKVWKFRTVEGQFNIDTDAGAGNEVTIFQNGNLSILGMLSQGSNRESKTNVAPVDPEEVLAKVAQLPLATWAYKSEQEVAHLGPMAQDFHELFQLGMSNTGITTYDTAGVALASIQALHRRALEQQDELAAKDARIAALEQALEQGQERNREDQIEALLRRVEALERASGASR